MVIYADVESTNLPTNDDKSRVHKANSYGFYVQSDFDEFPSGYYSYVGEDAAEQFLRQLLRIKEEVLNMVSTNRPIIMTEEDF